MANEKSAVNVQDVFLNQARKQQTPLTIHVTNGYQINKAVIRAYDSFVVLVESGGKQMMIYKHAISSITPDAPVQMNERGMNKNDD